MQMRRVRAGGTTSSPKHDKYLIRRNGNCQARLIVSHIISKFGHSLWSVSLSFCLTYSPFSLSAHLIAAKSHSWKSHGRETMCQMRNIVISLSCAFSAGVPHHSVLGPFSFLCVAILFFPVWGNAGSVTLSCVFWCIRHTLAHIVVFIRDRFDWSYAREKFKSDIVM